MRGKRSRDNMNALVKSVINRLENVVSYYQQQFYLNNT